MKRKNNILLSLMLATATTAVAQETLTLEQCREMALTHNKEMAASVRATESATYTAKSYKGNFYPNITINGAGLYSTADGSFGVAGGNLPTFSLDATGAASANGGFAYFPGLNLDYKVGFVYTGGVQLEQPIYMGGKISAAYKLATLGKEIAQTQQTLTATEVIVETEEAYANVVKADEMMKVADSYHNLLKELLRSVESAYNHGMKPQNDVLKVQVKLNESELAMRKAENARRLAAMNLCHLIGKPLTADIKVSSNLPKVSPSGSMQTFDISNRPEYTMLNKQVEAAKQQVKLNRSELLPKIGASASYSYIHGIEVNDQALLDKGNATVAINVSIPVFHFGERRNKVKAAKAKLEQTQLEQQNLNEKMLLELSQSANNLNEAYLERDIANRSLRQAEENMRVSRKQYEAGMESLSDHLEAQMLWQQAYETKVDAAFRLYLSHIAYLKATGELFSE